MAIDERRVTCAAPGHSHARENACERSTADIDF